MSRLRSPEMIYDELLVARENGRLEVIDTDLILAVDAHKRSDENFTIGELESSMQIAEIAHDVRRAIWRRDKARKTRPQ